MSNERGELATWALLWPPTNSKKDLKREYPELADIEEFRVLRSHEMKFVWYYTLLYKNEKENRRIELAFKNSYIGADGRCKVSKNERKEIEGGYFGENIKAAIARMERYDPDTRLRAKFIALKTLQHLESFINYEPEDEEDTLENRKKYTDMATNIMKELPGLIKIVESGFGMREVKASKEEMFAPPIDRWHDKNRQ